MCGLILEGVPASGKTTLLKALSSHPHFSPLKFPSRIILSDHHTQRVLEKQNNRGELTPRSALKLLCGHADYIRQRRDYLQRIQWCDPDMEAHRLVFMWERFHLSHVLDFDSISWEDVSGIDAQLADLNARHVILRLKRQEMISRIIRERQDQPHWNRYIRRFGATEDAVADHYSRQQEKLLELAERSRIPRQVIDTGNLSPEDCLREIVDFRM